MAIPDENKKWQDSGLQVSWAKMTSTGCKLTGPLCHPPKKSKQSWVTNLSLRNIGLFTLCWCIYAISIEILVKRHREYYDLCEYKPVSSESFKILLNRLNPLNRGILYNCYWLSVITGCGDGVVRCFDAKSGNYSKIHQGWTKAAFNFLIIFLK